MEMMSVLLSALYIKKVVALKALPEVPVIGQECPIRKPHSE